MPILTPVLIRTIKFAYFHSLPFLALLLGITPFFLLAQQPYPTLNFEHFNKKNGLPAEKVISVTQDHQGFIWIGTQEGLHRYDGYEFLTFLHDPDDDTSLSNSAAEVVYVDRVGALWVGTWNGLNRYDPLKKTFKRYLPDSENPGSLSGANIQTITEDQDGRLWIGTGGNGINRYDPETDAFIRYDHDPENERSLSYSAGTKLFLDRQGTLWVGTGNPWDEDLNRGGLNRYDPETDTFIRYVHDPNDDSSLGNNEISALYEDTAGRFWVATWGGGLQIMDREQGTFAFPNKGRTNTSAPNWPVQRLARGPASSIVSFAEDQRGILYVGYFQGGMDRFAPRTGAYNHYEADETNPASLSDDIVWSLFVDQQGILWISTWKGLIKVAPSKTVFQVIGKKTPGGAGLKDTHVEALLQDKDGSLWAGTWAGLEHLDPVSGTSELFPINNKLPAGEMTKMIISLSQDQEGDIWATSHLFDLFRLDPATRKLTQVHERPSANPSLEINAIIDKAEKIWVSGTEGAYRISTEQDEEENLNEYSNAFPEGEFVQTLSPSQQGDIWLGTGKGLYQYSPSLGKVSLTLTGYSIQTILDDGSTLWLGTEAGELLALDLATKNIDFVLTKKELPGSTVRALAKDEQNRLWISTDNGLAWIEAGQTAIRTFPSYRSPPIQHFYPNAVTQAPNGDLLFGGNGGVLRFDPSSVAVDSFPPIPVITGLLIFNDRADSLVKREFQDTGHWAASIQLPFRQNDLTFQYAGLHYLRPPENQFRYRLENYEEGWRYVSDQRTAIYPNLPPGEYVFRVQSANPDGIWSLASATMKVTISPPWWKTSLALGLFGLLLLVFLAFIVRQQRNKILKAERTKAKVLEAQLRAKVAESSMQQARELEESKARLYANITHEFRTPLTVIVGITNTIQGHQRERNLIQRNCQNLLRLINQLLDLSKLDADALALNPVQRDIIGYLRYLTESFHSLAQEKEIRLTFHPETAQLVMDFDEALIQQITYNLLSNALKFTQKGGEVVLHAAQKMHEKQPVLQLKVTDSGIGIPEKDLPRIFDRFYQTESSATREQGGTGIGLALTKKLVDLIGGKIEVESEVGKGTCFSLQFAIQNVAPLPDTPLAAPVVVAVESSLRKPSKSWVVPATGAVGAKPLLLLIEDNADLVNYIVGLLSPAYEVQIARDGQRGIELALETVPDIIISDVMMPEKDGYEVCRTLKQDERSSHIPIVLLTAKAAQDDRVKGLSVGADAYLVKPFHQAELFVQLDNLVILRQSLQKTYSGGQILSQNLRSKPAPTLEDAFLQKLVAVVTARMDDAELSVTHLCQAVRLSNTQVNRKLKALTGRTPSQFIRVIRLERAAELLQTTDLNVSEVAYGVGFNDPNYFTRVFSEEFGCSPSVARKQLHVR